MHGKTLDNLKTMPPKQEKLILFFQKHPLMPKSKWHRFRGSPTRLSGLPRAPKAADLLHPPVI